jgi:glutamate--cysteine ligase
MTTPTRDIDVSAPRITSKRELVERLAGGSKPREGWRIGTEHEKFAFRVSDASLLPYSGATSIEALLSGLAERYGWAPIHEGDRVIGLKRGGASVSLEPGGQFELSGAPVDTIHETAAEIGGHLAEANAVAGEIGAAFLGLGYSPLWSLEATPVMPKGRYGIMSRYMQKVGRLGREMMFRTCTVQANLDFSDEADMAAKMRVGLALQPIATALFASSPFAEGRTNGFLSYRGAIWADTDPDRTGMLPFAFEPGFGFERYVDFALDVPMYFVRRGGRYIDCAGQSFRDFMAGKLPALPGELPAMDDFDDHLSTIFPEVRLKTFLEMRGADAGPEAMLSALSAFWVGLMYDSTALDEASQLIRDWRMHEMEGMRRTVPAMGLQAPFRLTTVQALARSAVAIARGGLARRARRGGGRADETHFIAPLEEIAETGRNQAQQWLDLYRGEWRGDVTRVLTAARL